MGLLTILYFSLYYNLRVKIKSLGDQRLQANKLRFAVLNEALNNIKFVKFYRLESTYVLKFKNPSSDYSASVAIYATLNQVPNI